MPKAKHKQVKFSPEEMAYELPDEVDFSPEKCIVGHGILSAEMRGEKPLVVRYVNVDESSVIFVLVDGRRVSAPVQWYPRLVHALPHERNDWKIIMGGRAVRWPSLGLAVSAKALFDGTKAWESAASLRKWLSARNKVRRKSA